MSGEGGGPDFAGVVDFLARSLADDPDAVRAVEVEGPRGTVVELRVRKEDLGKVIGRQGRTARAARTLLAAAAGKRGRRCSLDIVE